MTIFAILDIKVRNWGHIRTSKPHKVNFEAIKGSFMATSSSLLGCCRLDMYFKKVSKYLRKGLLNPF